MDNIFDDFPADDIEAFVSTLDSLYIMYGTGGYGTATNLVSEEAETHMILEVNAIHEGKEVDLRLATSLEGWMALLVDIVKMLKMLHPELPPFQN